MGRGSLTDSVCPLRKVHWTDTIVSCGMWNKSSSHSNTKQMGPLVLEMELILMSVKWMGYSTAYSDQSGQVWKWSPSSRDWNGEHGLQGNPGHTCMVCVCDRNPTAGKWMLSAEGFRPCSQGCQWGDCETEGNGNYSLLSFIKASSKNCPHTLSCPVNL